MEVTILNKKESAKYEEKVIKKIGEDKDVVGFMNGHFVLLICYEVLVAILFIGLLPAFVLDKFIMGIIICALGLLATVYSIVHYIRLINKIQKTQIPSETK